jgi:hypothetical protein
MVIYAADAVAGSQARSGSGDALPPCGTTYMSCAVLPCGPVSGERIGKTAAKGNLCACLTLKLRTNVRLPPMTKPQCSMSRQRSCSTGWVCRRWREMSVPARGWTAMPLRPSASKRGYAASGTLPSRSQSPRLTASGETPGRRSRASPARRACASRGPLVASTTALRCASRSC